MAIIDGTSGADFLAGRDTGDLYFRFGGNDTALGGGSDDSMVGGAGSDTIFGGVGMDTIEGDGESPAGNDQLFGDAGNDMIQGEDGNDTIFRRHGERLRRWRQRQRPDRRRLRRAGLDLVPISIDGFGLCPYICISIVYPEVASWLTTCCATSRSSTTSTSAPGSAWASSGRLATISTPSA